MARVYQKKDLMFIGPGGRGVMHTVKYMLFAGMWGLTMHGGNRYAMLLKCEKKHESFGQGDYVLIEQDKFVAEKKSRSYRETATYDMAFEKPLNVREQFYECAKRRHRYGTLAGVSSRHREENVADYCCELRSSTTEMYLFDKETQIVYFFGKYPPTPRMEFSDPQEYDASDVAFHAPKSLADSWAYIFDALRELDARDMHLLKTKLDDLETLKKIDIRVAKNMRSAQVLGARINCRPLSAYDLKGPDLEHYNRSQLISCLSYLVRVGTYKDEEMDERLKNRLPKWERMTLEVPPEVRILSLNQ